MNEYEYNYKLRRAVLIKNAFVLTVMVGAIIYTGSLWWLLLLLAGTWVESSKQSQGQDKGQYTETYPEGVPKK